jgi:hypothetical protein
MDILSIRQLHAESYTLQNKEVRPVLTPLEQLQCDQLAFNAVRKATEDTNAKRCIESIVTNLDPHYNWVAQTDPQAIRYLSATVDSIKNDYYSQHQKPASAQHIYRHVRLKVETDTPEQQDEQALLLLEALMNGDVRTGTLPRLPTFIA